MNLSTQGRWVQMLMSPSPSTQLDTLPSWSSHALALINVSAMRNASPALRAEE